MKLYEWVLSANSRKVRAVAAELGLTIERVPIMLWENSHKKPEFLTKNPNGRVPVLEDGDFVLWESHAIICYLAAQYGEGRLLPRDPRGRAEVDRFLFWLSSHFDPALGSIVFETLVKPMMGLGAPDKAVIEKGRKTTGELLTVLEGWLATREYVAGALSVADFAIAGHLAARPAVGLDLSPYPNVTRWIDSIEARDSWKTTEPEPMDDE